MSEELSRQNRPLADRVRPAGLDEFVGQAQSVGGGTLLRKVIDEGRPVSLILWGPPGVGKTTLARIIARASSCRFLELSAVTSGVADVRRVIAEAQDYQRLGERTLLFIDEIHRFNKAQQDALLPHVEAGTITLIGATTENPSFEVIAPLLSRTRVVALQPLAKSDLLEVIKRGAKELKGRKLGAGAADLLAEMAAGDARTALNGLEVAAQIAGGTITKKTVAEAMQQVALKYDKAGEDHYNTVSAFIKSLRGSDPDAALYYLHRMIESGEDPVFIARRLVIFASEDIGMASPHALTLAVAGFQAVERIGLPEAGYTLSHVAIALATAPKSRAAAEAMYAARKAVKEHPAAQVPLHLRNAATPLMQELGYQKDYKWEAGFRHEEGFLPKALEGSRFYDGPGAKKREP